MELYSFVSIIYQAIIVLVIGDTEVNLGYIGYILAGDKLWIVK